MSMREAICATCGAINHADAHTCWRCLAEVRGGTEARQTSAGADGRTSPSASA